MADQTSGDYSKYIDEFLYNGQTGDLLAYASKHKGESDTGWINLDGPTNKNDRWPMYDPTLTNYDSAMIYISKVMKDDWTQ